MTGASVPARRDTLAGIELLRFICACAVLLWHYQHFSYVANQAHDFVTERQPFYGALALFYRYGLYGVQVFWCISGFIFSWKYGAAIAARQVTPGRFFLLRFSRLYPLHVATLLLVALLQGLYHGQHQYYFVYRDNSVGSFLLQLPLASHWLYPLTGFSFNGPIWSVSLEVLAYLFFYVYTRRLGAGLAATAGAALALGVLRHWSDWPVLECLLYFYLGALVALLYRAMAAWSALRRHSLNVALAALLAALLALPLYRTVDSNRLLLAATPLAIHLLLQWVRPRSAGLNRLLSGLGNLTYSSYLLHFPLQITLALACGALGRAVPLYAPGWLLGFLGLTMLLAHGCYRYFERPLQLALRRRYGGAPAVALRRAA